MKFAVFGSANANSQLPGATLGEGFHDYLEFSVEAEASVITLPISSSTISQAGTKSPRHCSCSPGLRHAQPLFVSAPLCWCCPGTTPFWSPNKPRCSI